MSWRLTRPMIEGMLLQLALKLILRSRKHALPRYSISFGLALRKLLLLRRMYCFIAGAGNEDENVEFVQSVPAGLNMDNLITVGAVDQALNPAGFTSFGQSIDVYANGFEILGRVPGGIELRLSGTSMAAPQVANLLLRKCLR